MPIPVSTQLWFVLLVFAGGGLGSTLRYGVNLAAVAAFGPHYPWGTLSVNVVGSAVMGVIAGWLLARDPGTGSDALRLFLMTGILGGFTTFSAFSLDTIVLAQRGATAAAVGYAVASVVVSVAALAAALALTKAALAP